MAPSTTTPAPAPQGPLASVPLSSHRYGLDIETDTTVDGLDATQAAILAVAVSTTEGDEVFTGDEHQILRDLDDLLAGLPPGLLVTWNGTFFDLPFIVERAALAGIELGLRLGDAATDEWPPPHRPGPHRCSWWQHRHLDGYRLYRNDLGRALGLSCGLKSLSRLAGFQPVEVDRSAMHLLTDQQMHDYVASDARLARLLVDRRMPRAFASTDLPAADGGPRPGAALAPRAEPPARLH